MPFQKGNPGKPKGAVNKNTEELRQFVIKFLQHNSPAIQSEFDSLKPEAKLKFFSEILQYAIPKYRNVENQISGQLTLITFKDAE